MSSKSLLRSRQGLAQRRAVPRSKKRSRLLLELLEDRLVPTTYDVGPGFALTTVGAVPWSGLQAGDVVNIHWQTNPYHEKIILSNSGTATQHIVVNGIAGPLGQLPVLDGSNATSSPNLPHFSYTPLQDFGLIVVFRDQTKPAGYQPSYIDINNLQLQGAVGGTSYKGYAGDSRTYVGGASGIWTEGSANLTIHGCTVTNNDNGVFAKSNGTDNTYHITLDSNYLYGNGVNGNFLFHNSYIEAYGALYQYNRYGPLRAGAPGNALKDRSSSTVIRYNYIIDGGHILDLDEPQDGYSYISTDPNYLRTLVYGNVLVSDANGPTLLVHYGDGGGGGLYRNGGVLYFYNNTVINQEDQSQRWYTIVFQMDVSTVSVDARNNIFYNTSQTPGATPSLLEFGQSNGNINFATANWVSPGWLSSRSAETGTAYNGTITGTNNFFVDPNNNPAFANLATYDAHILTGSGAIGRSGSLASAVATAYPVTSQYVYNQGSQTRPTASDLGAFAYAGSTSGSASSLTLGTAVTSSTAGSAFTITVTAKDASGNTATGYTGTVHFTSSDAQAALPANYTFTAADAGVHTFNVTLKTAGSDTFTVSDTSSTSLTATATVTVNPAAASLLSVSGFPASIIAGTAGTITVKAKDGYGNVATAYAGTVHFTSSDLQAVLPADYTFVSTDQGAHSFSVTLKTAGSASITATDNAAATITGTQTGITVNVLATQLVVSGFPSATTAGVAGTVTVTAEDALGNLAKGYTGIVHFTSSDSQAGLPADYTFVSADNGVHSFSITLKTAGTQSITATDKITATITGTQSSITVAAAAASNLVVSGFPTSATAGTSATVTVTAQDPYSNVSKSYTGTVHFTSSDSQAALPADYTFVSADNGAHSFSVTLKTAGTQSITATDKTTATITGTESGITVAAAAASRLAVSGFPTSATAGVAGSITATAQDAYGNVAKSYTGTVHFTSTDSQAGLPADYTFVGGDNGVHSFSVTLKTAGAQSITATDKTTATITGMESGITVAAAAASKLVVSGFPTSATAGVAGTITTTAQDAYGNVAKSYMGTVHFTSTDSQAGLPADYTFVSGDNGVHSFSVTLKTAGAQSITATDKTTATITGTESGISVAAAAASTFVVSGFPISITAGTAGTVTATAQDGYGNVAKGYAGTVHFTSSDAQAGLPADYTFVSGDQGVHSFSVTLQTAGTQSITATDTTTSTITGTESGITVIAGASQFVLSGFPTSVTAGVAGLITVTAEDSLGSVVTNYTGTVHFTSSDSQAGLPADYTFVSGDNGVHSFSVTLKTAGGQSIIATDKAASAIRGAQSGITVAAAAASTLAVSGFPASTTAGTSGTVSVAAQDAFGNVAKNYTGTVHFTSTDSQAGLPADYTFVGGDNGVHSFSLTLKSAGTQSITATDKTAATITGTESGVTVAAAAASKLVVSGFPTSVTAGVSSSVTVTAQDAYGNMAKSYTGTVHFTSTDSQAGLPADYTFVGGDNGVHSFSVTLKTAAAQSITATDKTTATITGTEAGITVAAAAASRLAVSGFPTSATAGVAGTVTATAQDAYGNLAKSYTGTVHFTSTDAQAGLPADYTFVGGDNGVHSFSVTLKTAGAQSITATDKTTATITGTESGITVAAATASRLAVSGFPTSATAGVAGTVTVTAQDAYGNVAKSYTGTVHFTSTDSQASLPADYTFVGGDNGVHSFSVTLKTAGAQSITVTDTTTATITGTESGITVAAAASTFMVSGFPTSIMAGVAGTITVTAEDAFGNVATGYSGTVHFTSTDSQATLPANYTFVSADKGSHSFSVTLKTAGSQNVTATDQSTASLTGTQSGISVTPAVTQLVVSGFPTSATAGVAGTVTVTAQDAFGNVAKSYTGTVHFTSTDSQAGLPADFAFVGGDNGVHSFSVTLKTAGTQSITATDKTTATITGTESGINVAAAAASTIVVSGFPTSATAGIAGTATVTAQDAFGNVAKSYTGTVHFTSSDAQAALPADYAFVGGDNGVHSFSVTLKTSAAQSITATDTTTATITGTESGINVAAAAASTIVVSGFPTSATAGLAGTVTVTAQDAFANVAKSYTGTAHFTSSDPQAVLPADYTFVSGDQGVHSFSVTLRTAGAQWITATDRTTATITGTQSGITVIAGASQLVVSGFPTAATAGVAGTVTVTAEDAFGNGVKSYTGTVHFTSSDSQAGLPADYTFVGGDNGMHSFSVTLRTAGAQSITATDKTTAIITGTQSGISVAAAAASKFLVAGLPSQITAGTAGTVTVAAQDAFGNVATGYAGKVHFTSTDKQASLPADYTFVSTDKGSHAFIVTLKKAGSQSVTGTDQINTSITGTESGILVKHAPASQYVVSGLPTSMTAGTTGTSTVTAQDPYGNVDTDYAGKVHFSSTDKQASLPANYTFVSADQGSHSFSVTPMTAGSQTVTGTDVTSPSITGAESGIAVSPGIAQQLVFAGQSASSAAGTLIRPALTVQVLDQFGNLVSGDNSDSVTVTVAGGPGSFTSGSATSVTVSGGVASFGNLALSDAGAYTISANTAGLITAAATVHVARTGPPPSWLTAVANNMTHSAEYYTLIVDAAYQRYLGRLPDSTGLANWVGQMQRGLTDEYLEAGFIGSPEYIQTHGGAGAGWITGMYQNLLGRNPSPAEVTTWLQALANGQSTTNIAYGFAASPEREGQIVTADYQQYLGRNPTAAEVSSWVTVFENGSDTNENVVGGFVGSTEYFHNHFRNASDWFAAAYQAILGLPSTQAGAEPSFLPAASNSLTHSAEYFAGIVTAAYQRYLGRTPDSAGLASWVAQMQQGLSDELLEANFIGSNEFIQNHGGLGAGWIKAMYQGLLGRTPSQAEIDNWILALTNGVSSITIAYQFAASPEREGQRVTADYVQYLGRTPTAAEVASWVNDFESGAVTNENVVAGFMGSLEYFQKYNGDSQHWWNQAVQALFGASGF